MIVKNSSGVRQQYILLLKVMAAIFLFRIWTQDVTQVYQ